MAEVEYVDWKLVLRAQLTPDHLLGRVISTARVVTFGLQPLSLCLAGVLLDLAGGAALWMLGGASLAASAAFWLLGGARRTLADPSPASASRDAMIKKPGGHAGARAFKQGFVEPSYRNLYHDPSSDRNLTRSGGQPGQLHQGPTTLACRPGSI